jgi:hypothetical protein
MDPRIQNLFIGDSVEMIKKKVIDAVFMTENKETLCTILCNAWTATQSSLEFDQKKAEHDADRYVSPTGE